jgi:ATP-dependent DNA helicase RecG
VDNQPLPLDINRALDAILAGATADSVESDRLEFKRQGRSRPDTMKTVAEAAMCLANAAGGYVVLGVADRIPGAAAFEGTDVDAMDLARRVYELTEPHLTLRVEAHRVRGRVLLVVDVPAGVEVIQVDGRATRRLGASCQPMSGSMFAAAVAERRGEDWSATDTGRKLSTADLVAIEYARGFLRQSADPTRRDRAEATDHDLLRQLGVVSPRGTLLEAGRVLFVKGDGSPQISYHFRKTPAGTLVVNEHLPGSGMGAIARVLDLVTARIESTPLGLPSGVQIQLEDLPTGAVREAIVNAVAHRDYRRPGVIRVEHSPTRFRVSSPGPLVPGVTPANILTASRPRNPTLANAIRAVGLAEQAGVGVDRMYVEMTRLGYSPPTFESDELEVTVTLLSGAPNTQFARFVATLPPEHSDDADTLLVLFRLLSTRKMTAGDLTPLLQKPVDEVENHLRQLSAPPSSLIEPTRQSARRAHPEYRLQESVVAALGSAVTYHRRTPDEIDRKIIGLVEETRQINARMVKIMLDLDTKAASRTLADLVRRGILAKTSEAQRGRAVTYGPGSAFPGSTARRRPKRRQLGDDESAADA